MCDFFFREAPKQVRLCTLFGVLDNDRQSAQPSCCYDAFGWMDFPTAVVIKNRPACHAITVRDGFRLPGLATLRCDSGGEEFMIYHDAPFADKTVAERQAHWLDKVLADEHKRERKHPDRLPAGPDRVRGPFRQRLPVPVYLFRLRRLEGALVSLSSEE